ncbi:MAG: protein translocase subunit SecF [Clostridia bacterium]|nr:protein translocase subunit SecF [Clostridia bacterium]
MKKLGQLFEQDFKIVENKKKIFLVPALIVVIAIIFGFIFHFATGDALNLGMDFTGGYKINITLGNRLTNDTYAKYKNMAVSVAEGLTDDEGVNYGLKISTVSREGDVSGAKLVLKYKSIGSAEKMDEINEKLRVELEETMFFYAPTVVKNSARSVVATYDTVLSAQDETSSLKTKLETAGFVVDQVTLDSSKTVVTVAFGADVLDTDLSNIVSAMTIKDTYSGIVTDGGTTTATVSNEYLLTALIAVCVSLICMLIYIVIRFELLSAISAVVALAHDILIMFCAMVIFHIEINSTFIAALITILGYSINNTIIIFDRVREIKKMNAGKRINGKLVKPDYIANKSVQNTVWRSINTTLTTIITISMVAIIGVADIQVFALPIIFGLLAGTYSSMFIAPSVWAWLMVKFPGKKQTKKFVPKKNEN